ncbi:hypothetical protein ACMA5I_02315 [Paracoccaceae bacterium GXU_MW_L88]
MAAEQILEKKLTISRATKLPITQMDQFSDTLSRNLDSFLRACFGQPILAQVNEAPIRNFRKMRESVPPAALLAKVSVDGARDSGYLVLPYETVSRVVELRLGGDPTQLDEVVERRATAIDMALCKEFSELFLQAFILATRTVLGARAGAVPVLSDLTGDPSHLDHIAPDHADMMTMNMEIAVADTKFRVPFQCVLPLSMLDLFRTIDAPLEGGDGQDMPDFWSEHMTRAITMAPLVIDAQIFRGKISLADLSDLEPGEIFEMSGAATDNLSLRVGCGTIYESELAVGRLGRGEKGKGAKLVNAPDEDIIHHLAQIIRAETAD